MREAPNRRYFLSYTKTGPLDGFPTINIFDSGNLKKLNTIAVNDETIETIEFSGRSNMLLVVSSSVQSGELVSTLSIWDFMDGHKDIFCKSMVPVKIHGAAWNPYLSHNADEFVTIADRTYHYWKVSDTLQLQYQEGDIPTKEGGFQSGSDKFTTACFVKPDALHHSVYLMLGLSTGYVWLLDTRVN